MWRFYAVATIVTAILPCDAAYSRTWYVTPDGTGDVSTIQAAVDAARPGDDILLAPGTYSWTNQSASGNSMILMKSGILLHSEAGAASTILDAGWCGRVILCDGVDNSAEIRGITVKRGGIHGSGGGILCKGGSTLVIADNIITDCGTSEFYCAGGGGIACVEGASPRIENNVITSCTSYCGGGIYCGGGSNPLIIGNEISDICTQPPELDWATYGGGIYLDDASATIKENWIHGNTASYGAGVGATNSEVELEGNLIEGNFCYMDGAAIWCQGNVLYAFHNTVVGNEVWQYSWDSGGAVCCYSSSTAYIWCNLITGTVSGRALSCANAGDIDLRSNNLWENAGGDANCEILGDDNLHEDPLFCAPEVSDYTLRGDSPCLVGSFPCMGRIGAYGEGCSGTPVMETSWGRIKAIYR